MSDEPKKFHAGTFKRAVPGEDQKSERVIHASDEKLLEFLKHPGKSLEPLGPLAGPALGGWFEEEE